MNLLIDTNVLLRVAQTTSPEHTTAKSSLLRLAKANTLCVVPQVIYEYWVVATRPVEKNGLGMFVEDVEESIKGILAEFRLLKDERGIFDHWRLLVLDNKVKGKTAHDARLVAAMQRHGLTNLLSFNKSDFVRFVGINVFTPPEVLAGQTPS